MQQSLKRIRISNMKGNTLLLHLSYTLLLLLGVSSSSWAGNSNDDDPNRKEVYIVYMGAASSTNASLRSDHAQILNLVLKRDENALVRNYKHGFSGFAARLSKEEATSIAQKPGVVSVFRDPILKLHTTRSWDFLESQTRLTIDTKPKPNTISRSSSSSDVILGILDTGIWPEAASFSDEGFGPVPSRWKGTCMTSKDFNSSNCNRKIIGARFYTYDESVSPDELTPRDLNGHGTHVASTAVGVVVSNVSYYGLAPGTAKGGSPESRVAMYKVCDQYGFCSGSGILAGFDDAIHDGVDVLSLSLGGYPGMDLTEDVVAIGAFHAVERGILVVCAGGNSGDSKNTVVNDSPWILTVGASTIDRDLQSDVVLGNNQRVQGRAINFSPLSNSPKYPMVYGESAMANTSTVSEARQCHDNSLDRNKVKGKIVVCDGRYDGILTIEKVDTVQGLGAIGLVHMSDASGSLAFNFFDYPATDISSKNSDRLLQYINSTSNPVGTVLATVTVPHYKPAPVVGYFSSRGPSSLSGNILKPDVAAPGVNILAAWRGNGKAPKGRKPSAYNIISGTSMACPHVSGLACSIKTRNPSWSASAIKSSIITTAIQSNNLKGSITTDSGSVATPYDYGAGEITRSKPLQPGLVYETRTIDYLNFLCYIGLNVTTIKLISGPLPHNFDCPIDSRSDLISNINYPSITVNFTGKSDDVIVSRTVTNVGEDESVYIPNVKAPREVIVTITPDKLEFTKNRKTLSYKVIFSPLTSFKKDLFGSITWKNDKYIVRSPFVITI